MNHLYSFENWKPHVSWKRIVDPAVEPIEIDRARLHVKVDVNDDDTVIEGLVSTAREYFESKGRALITQTWELYLDGFPYRDLTRMLDRYWWWPPIFLPVNPVRSISFIKYIDQAGVIQTWNPSLYLFDSSSEPARITPAYGQVWPIPIRQMNSVTIRFVAGYGDTAAAVPSRIITGLKLLMSHLYQNRDAVGDGNLKEIPLGMQALLESSDDSKRFH